MRKFLLNIYVMLVIMGCTTNIADSNIVEDNHITELKISIIPTRTSLGAKDGDSYPIYWSEEDKIVANGILSQDALINTKDRAEATFNFDNALHYPLNIVYPYTSATTVESPKVIIPDIQHYAEGSFSTASVPMCGYLSKKEESVGLKHLGGLLRFTIVGSAEDTILEKVVITSTEGVKLSGEFTVNCSTATISACENSTNTITYNLPENFTLSTSKESTFYISLPAGNTGNCTIEFIEKSGEKMTCLWGGKNLKAGVIQEFKTIIYQRGVNNILPPMNAEDDTLSIYYSVISGYVKDSNGKAIAGVAVSDGFSVVATDSNGFYTLNNVTKDCRYIYISIPSEYEIPTNKLGQPSFYKPYPSDTNRYDFTLTPLAGGKEEKFALFTFADPQVSSNTGLSRFLSEAVPNIKKHCDEVESGGITCYGITLGDIISNGDSKNTGDYRDDMRDGFAESKMGMPVFQVMGNHDNTYYNSTKPLFTDERSSTFELKAQREHEDIFGPVNYSFNRGDVHIIGMRDIIYQHNNTSAKYVSGLLPAQYEWLKQDLALVPKDKMVVLCMHIQFFNNTANYKQEVLSLLDQYKEAHIMTGHTHRQQLYDHKTKSESTHKVYEHNSCAVCGAWWVSNIAGDGTPNGYNVFIGEGNSFSDWYYMGYSNGMNTRSHQMRLYRGNAVTGGPIEGTNNYGIKGYYAFNFADNVLLANVYNADEEWTIEVFEDDKFSGTMTCLTNSQPEFSALVGDYTFDNPRRAADGVVTAHDFYVSGLHLGILNRWSSNKNKPSNASYDTCWHMYKYSLKNKDAKIKVVATDCFGNKYTETVITEGTDYTLTKKPQ